MSCEIGIELGEPQDDVITIYQEIRTHCDSKTKKKKRSNNIEAKRKPSQRQKKSETNKSVAWRVNMYAEKKLSFQNGGGGCSLCKKKCKNKMVYFLFVPQMKRLKIRKLSNMLKNERCFCIIPFCYIRKIIQAEKLVWNL